MIYIICIAFGFIIGVIVTSIFSIDGHIEEVERLEAEVARLRRHLGETTRKEGEDE